jgi:hypothetical protein
MYTENIYSKFYTEHLMARNTEYVQEHQYAYNLCNPSLPEVILKSYAY